MVDYYWRNKFLLTINFYKNYTKIYIYYKIYILFLIVELKIHQMIQDASDQNIRNLRQKKKGGSDGNKFGGNKE